MPIPPPPCALPHLPPLGSCHRLERAPERRPTPRFDLDEGDEVPLPHDEIDLLVPHAEPVRQDVPAAGQQILDRLFLASESALVAGVRVPRPGGRACGRGPPQPSGLRGGPHTHVPTSSSLP